MKAILILITFAFLQNAYAQDYCKRIKTEISDDKTMYDYTSPYNEEKIPAVRVTRKYSTDAEIGFDNFSMIFQITGPLDNMYNKTPDGGQTEKDEKGLIVEFEDHSKLAEESIAVSHDVTDDKMQGIRLVYYPLTDASLKDLTAKKIIKFSLAGYEQAVPADSAIAIQHYIQCMKSVK